MVLKSLKKILLCKSSYYYLTRQPKFLLWKFQHEQWVSFSVFSIFCHMSLICIYLLCRHASLTEDSSNKYWFNAYKTPGPGDRAEKKTETLILDFALKYEVVF